ncbi:MFS transporter [Leptolyngbya sp. GB1-A1]|uniref:MFS transporter n=1 Tax=Leptolyngbya sp. GB1-A1 TaxID=2933908 RepID=UPI0032971A4C
MNPISRKFQAQLPKLNRAVWILMLGRLLSQVGTGFVLFYAAVFFVNEVGLSATAVGIGIGSESISGVFGRIIGGLMSDSPRWGRRKTLLLSAAFSAVADIMLALSYNFPTFLLSNLLMGLGVGLYWPSMESAVADLTAIDQRNEAYALTRLADNLGLALGVVFGGLLIGATGAFRLLFWIDGISFVVFLGIIHGAIRETLNVDRATKQIWRGWAVALRDHPLRIYVAVNVLFTTYLSLLNTALPLYLTNFVGFGQRSGQAANGEANFTALSLLFTWYIVLAALLQLPVARWLNRYTHPQVLSVSAVFWAIGFLLVWLTGSLPGGTALWAGLSVAVMAIATIAYTPAASALVANLAPESMRGVYLSINSLCWAVGYFIGPIIGGWAMGQSIEIAHSFWLVGIGSVGVAIGILVYLDRSLKSRAWN